MPDLLRPRRLILYDGGRSAVLTDPFVEAYGALWDFLRDLAAGAGGPLEPLPAGRAEALRTAGMGAEALLPVPLSLGQWTALWGGVSGEAGPTVDRVAVFAGQGDGLVLCFGAAGAWSARSLPSGGGALMAAVRASWAAAEPGERLSTPATGPFRVASGLVVPRSGPRGRQRATAETLDARALAASLFPDLAVVREVESRDGTLLFTDGAATLQVLANRGIEFLAPRSEGAARERPLLDAVREAAAFVSLHGGWQGDAVLLRAGDRIEFTVLAGGLPVIGGPGPLSLPGVRAVGLTAPVELTLGPTGSVRLYRRALSLPERPSRSLPVLPAGEALALLATVPQLAGGAGGHVMDAYLAYLNGRPLPPSGEMPLVWVFELDSGLRLAVDAHTGSPYVGDLAIDRGRRPGS
ncbi:MAG: hypothetical protein IRY95_01140 [Clostridia bacterium]|nr:hypothetical protein [Clostridia bacterium]